LSKIISFIGDAALKLRYRICFFVVGIYIASWGLFFLTVYSSLLNMGYSISEFFSYLINKPEVYMLILGFILAMIGMFAKKKD